MMCPAMWGAEHRGRCVALGLVLTGATLFCRTPASALNPALDVSQYAHTAWKIREGFPKGTIFAIAQTPDGYLWLGTEFGLYRFDGVRSVPWTPAGWEQLPSSDIRSLLAARDGTLWIGTQKGLASWKDGKLTRYPSVGEQTIFSLLEDRDGTVWAGGLSPLPPGKLCAIRGGSIQCYGEDGAFDLGVLRLFEDSKGTLWVGAGNGMWRWKPGPPKFYALPEPAGIRALAEDVDGTLLVGWKGGLWRFADGKTEPYPLPRGLQPFTAMKLFRDHDGGLWIGTFEKGVVHVHQGRTDMFAQADGLSSNSVTAFLEGREGGVWVATYDGLDRFREFAVVTYGAKQGLPTTFVASVLAGIDGSIWLGGVGALYRWKNGEFNTYNNGDGKLNGIGPMSLFRDARGKVWVATSKGVGYIESDRFVPSGISEQKVYSFAEDKGGNLWMANAEDVGLIRLSARNEIQKIPWAELGHNDYGVALVIDPLKDGLWIGFLKGGVSYFADGRVRSAYTAADGLGSDSVNHLRFGSRGALWAATEGGLSRIRDGRIATLSSKNGLPCDTVYSSIEDDEHFVWLVMPCGLVRIARPELDAWAAATERDKNAQPTVPVTVFDISEGVRGRAAAGYSPYVTKSADGKLWFTGYDGVAVVDPKHLPFNKLPPPVHVEQITADHKTYDAPSDAAGRLRLPPLIRDLQIDYTALSLVAPEKVRFRYKLEGFDRDWQEVGNRRQAFYTNLPPRSYRFLVKASNNSGVWNEEGTFLDFSIAPAYYQTKWFQVLCLGAFVVLLWALYQFRLQQIQQRFNAGLEARVNERTRIARELHDTLLQSFHAILFQFQAARNVLPQRFENEKAMQTMDDAIVATEQAIVEGRDAIRDLRRQASAENDLEQLLTTAGHELAALQDGNQHSVAFRVIVEGEPQKLLPMLQDEVYRIGKEVIRNAFRHASADNIEVEIRYDERQLRLRFRDDGKGIERNLLQGSSGTAGHWGLPGMRERAQRIGAKLDFWSEAGAGTEVELTVPAKLAYETARDGSRFRLFPQSGKA